MTRRDWVANGLILGGGACISVGIGLFSLPVALIVTGLMAIVGAFLISGEPRR